MKFNIIVYGSLDPFDHSFCVMDNTTSSANDITIDNIPDKDGIAGLAASYLLFKIGKNLIANITAKIFKLDTENPQVISCNIH